MGRYILKRLLNTCFILVGTTLLSYLLIYLAPSDPAQIIAAQRLGGHPNPAQVEWVRQKYGLDQPWPIQYVRWLKQAVQGDFGFSIRTGNLISEEMSHALRYSLILALWASGFIVLVGVASGVWAALHPHTLGEQLLQLAGLVCVSIPEFWLAFLLILLFAVKLGWLPSHGAKSGLHLILPILSLGLGQAARLSRLTHTLLFNEIGKDYLRTARAKGRTPVGALLRHGLPNIAVPFVTLLVHQFGLLVSGALIIETLFTWPGLGNYYITAIEFRDVPVIQVMVLFFAALIVFLNLLADLSYVFFDPRIRLEA